MVTIAPVTAEDRADWQKLWEGFLEFYESSDLPADVTEHTFASLLDPDAAMQGVLARDDDGNAVGLAHFFTHPATWTKTTYTYLEDLYVSPDSRGGGTGRALIEHVADWAREQGSTKLTWVTNENNATARALYDRVGGYTGEVRYAIKF